MAKLYRYEIQYKNVDGDPTDVILREFEVLRETEHTYFINEPTLPRFAGKFKRVTKGAYNTYAYNTKAAALEHFTRRTFRRIQWFDFWRSECETALEIAKTINTNNY